MRSNIIDVEVQIIRETDKAVQATGSGDRKDAVWLPRSQIELSLSDTKGLHIVTLPQWLAEEKGLV